MRDPHPATIHVALYCDCNSRGGVLTYTVALATALRKRGARISILTHLPGNALEREMVGQLAAAATTLVQVPPCSTLASDTEILASMLGKLKPDIFVPNYRDAPYAACALRARDGLRSVGVVHTDSEACFSALKRYASALTHFVGATEASTAALAHRLERRGLDVSYIPHGVRIPARCAPYRGGPIKVIYHGRLCDDQKQAGRLLDVADALVAQGVQFSMRLIGDGPQAPQYAARVASSRLAAHVSIEEGMPWERLSAELSSSHVALLTSEHEGFCFSLAEAMAAGLPGVAFRLGGVIESYLEDGRNGFLVAQGAVSDAANAIGMLWRRPELWQMQSEHARATISQRFSWERSADHYLALFERCLRKSFRPQWPALRPTWVPPGRSVRSITERVGKLVRAW